MGAKQMAENKPARGAAYGGTAKTLHWLIVVILSVQFAVAWTMPDIGRGTQPGRLIALHLSIGFLVLILAILRLLWRLAHPVEPVTEGVPRWQVRAAQAVHWLLYFLLLALPVLGWASASARGWSLRFFGLLPVPSLLPADPALAGTLGNVHQLAAYTLLGLVALHVLAALYHHFVLRDRVLLRMLPERR